MPTTKVLISEDDIRGRIVTLAAEIERDYPQGEGIHLVAILKGGFMFMADLVRAMSDRVTMDFMAVSSYGKGTTSSGQVRRQRGIDRAGGDDDDAPFPQGVLRQRRDVSPLRELHCGAALDLPRLGFGDDVET